MRRSVGMVVAAGVAAGVLVVAPTTASAVRTSVDVTFGSQGTAYVPPTGGPRSDAAESGLVQFAVSAGGHSFVAGRAEPGQVGVTRFDSAGSPVSSFGTAGSAVIDVGDDLRLVDAQVQSDNRLVLLLQSRHEVVLIRLDDSGAIDPLTGTAGSLAGSTLVPFPLPSTNPEDLAVTAVETGGFRIGSDGSFFVPGTVRSDGVRSDWVAKIAPNGGSDESFAEDGLFPIPSSGQGSWGALDVESMEVDADDRVYVKTTRAAGTVFRRITAAGTQDTTFDPIPAGVTTDLIVRAGSLITVEPEAGDDPQALVTVVYRMTGAPFGYSGSSPIGDAELFVGVATRGDDSVALTRSFTQEMFFLRRIGPLGSFSTTFGDKGVARLPSSFVVDVAQGEAAIDGSRRPLLAYRQTAFPGPPDGSGLLQVTRFQSPRNATLEEPSADLTGQSKDGTSVAGDPVNTATGNLTGIWTDLSLDGFGLTVTRAYNGLSTLVGSAGPRWSVSTGPWLRSNEGDVVLVLADGTQYRFVPNGAGGFVTPDGVAGTLSVDATTPSGGGSLPMLRLEYADGSVDRFDTSGRLLSQSRWDGQSATLAYGANGLVSSVTSSNGQALTFGYDVADRISSVSGSDGRSVTYTYTPEGWLSTITDEHGGVWSVTYTAEGWLVTLTDPAGVVLEDNIYDTQGRVIEQILPSGVKLTFSYDVEPGVTVVDEAQLVEGSWVPMSRVEYHHDSSGRAVAIVDPFGNYVEQVYDERGNLVQTASRTDREASAVYDTEYNLTSLSRPGEGTMSWTYDSENRVTSMTDPWGATTTYTYEGSERSPATVTDALGNTASYTYEDGLITSTTDADGVTTTFAYDSARRMVSSTDELGNTTSYTYDDAGRTLTVTSPGGRVTTNSYFPNGRLRSTTAPDGGVTSYTYDAAGKVLTVTDPTGAITTNTYNAAGLLEVVTDPEGFETRHVYDARGKRIATERPGGAVTNTEFDELNRPVASTSALGDTTTTTYNAEGEPVSTTVASTGSTTSTVYDDAGRVVETIDPAGRVSTTEYDDNGRVVSTTAPGDAVTSFEYDLLGRQVVVVDPRGGRTVTSYTPAGRTASVTDAAGLTTTFGYDVAGRRITVTAPGDRTTTTELDADGQTVRVVSPSGLEVSYTYDAAGRVLTSTDPAGVVTSRTYTLRGEVASERIGAQAASTFTYTPRGLLASTTDPLGHTTTMTYDANGNLVTRTDPLGGIESWEYNDADQVVSATDQLGRITTLEYDVAGRLTEVTDPSGVTRAMTYNADGTVSAVTNGAGEATTITYDEAGRVASMDDPTGIPVVNVYSSAGDLLEQTAGNAVTRYGYDVAGRRTSMRYPDGRGVDYEYNEAGELAVITQSELLIDSFGSIRVFDTGVPDPGSWTRSVSTGSTVTVVDERLVLSVPDTVNASAVASSRVPARMDVDLSFSYQFGSVDPATKGRLIAYARLSSAGHYRVEIAAGEATGTVFKRVGTVTTRLGTFPVPATDSVHQLRLRVVGDTVAVTVWNPDDAEPETPTVSFTSGGVTTPGTARVQLRRLTGASSVAIDGWVQVDPTAPLRLASYTYDADGRLTTETLVAGGRTRSYTDGYLTGFESTVPGAVRQTVLGYDSTGRIASDATTTTAVVAGVPTTSTVSTVYGYDVAGQLVSSTPSTGNASAWTYDALGRRTSERVGTVTTRYVYDAASQLCWTRTGTLPVNASCASPPSNAARFGYDGAGRLVSEVRSATSRVDYSYDADGLVSTVVRVAGTATTTQEREYRADGLLATTDTFDAAGAELESSVLVWDVAGGGVPQPVSMLNTARQASNLVFGPGGWASVHAATVTPVSVAVDVHGSVVRSTGNALARASGYSAFGVPVGGATFGPRLGYRGEVTIDQQLYLRARWLQPSIGAFTSVDPAPGRAGWTTFTNPYHYVDNSPLNRIDPTGRTSDTAVQGDGVGGSSGVGSSGPGGGCDGSCGARSGPEPLSVERRQSLFQNADWVEQKLRSCLFDPDVCVRGRAEFGDDDDFLWDFVAVQHLSLVAAGFLTVDGGLLNPAFGLDLGQVRFDVGRAANGLFGVTTIMAPFPTAGWRELVGGFLKGVGLVADVVAVIGFATCAAGGLGCGVAGAAGTIGLLADIGSTALTCSEARDTECALSAGALAFSFGVGKAFDAAGTAIKAADLEDYAELQEELWTGIASHSVGYATFRNDELNLHVHTLAY